MKTQTIDFRKSHSDSREKPPLDQLRQTPDFTIFDLQLCYSIAVVEDKSPCNPTADVNVEAQLIIEAIAMAQANTAKDESKPTKRTEGYGGYCVEDLRARDFNYIISPHLLFDLPCLRSN